ncbi:uncharacterized protein LOC129938764 isoform X2 [Eupeodes corollae]|uniref:uncharacterized protein LOC129938764 isoform X2 n=1 Tax=Eupeodes corollae TaxID=290404 RepID=UPI00249164DB|nr:uncharacterized protein LOC129938764 isoform X2 [Eupeodes corollae]
MRPTLITSRYTVDLSFGLRYYDMFIKHCPWGRPGGGAPNVDVRRRDISSIGLHSTPSISAMHLNRSSSVLLPCRRYSNYFSPGKRRKCHRLTMTEIPDISIGNCEVAKKYAIINNTPLSGDGKVHHEKPDGLQIILKDHPAMTFRNKGHVDIEVCYKSLPKGKQTLDKIVVNKKDECPSSTTLGRTSKKHRNKANGQNWAKPAPGGKSCSIPKGHGSSFMRSLGWTNKEMLKELDQDNPVTPAEKLTFKKRPVKKSDKCCAVCTCKCPEKGGSPIKTSSSSPNKDYEKINLNRKGNKNDSKVTICPRLSRNCTKASDYHDGGGVELVPLLARRRAEIRPISLSSTDVTKRTSSDNRWTTKADLEYLSDLNKQMSQKRRSFSMSQQLEKDLCSKHFETFDTFWGRPGHGAPTNIRAKLKLDDLLYGVQSCTE